jgi:uncharacterized protein with HEPN domain
MPRNLSLLLQDIAVRSQRAQSYVKSVGFEQFAQDNRVRDAVERNLQIVGEALTQALVQDRSLVWKISETHKIVAFRHLLTHHYYRVSPTIVWAILGSSLPQLDREIATLRAGFISPEGLIGTTE